MTQKIDALRRFYNGRIYPILLCVLILLGNATGYDVAFGIAMLLSVVPGCWLCHDLRFALVPFMCAVFVVTGKTYTPGNTGFERYLRLSVVIPFALTVLIFLVSLIVFSVRNRKTANPLPRGGMLLGLSIFCIAMLCNGFFTREYTPQNLLFAAIFSASLVFFYLLFACFLDVDDTLFEHFMYCLVLAGILISAELLVAYATTVQFVNGEIVKGSVVLGWGVWTHIGGMLTFLLPAHFYFVASHRHGWIGYITGFLQYFCILLSQSRGALLVGTGVLGLCLLYLLIKGENRRINRIVIASMLICGVGGMFLLRDRLLGLLQNFMNMGFSDNGRFALWKSGLNNFLGAPVFGSGFYDCYVPEAHDGWDRQIYPYFYHSTPIQILASAGLVGVGAYLYHRVLTIRLVFRRPTPEKTFLGFCILGLLLFSLIDVLFFKTYPTIIYALMLLIMDRRDQSLPREAI